MASTFATFRVSPIVSSSSAAASNHRKSYQNRNRPPPPSSSSSSSSTSSRWWFPLFGWTADTNYISSNNKKKSEESIGSDSEAADLSGYRFPPPAGCFTEKKAKQLRRKTVETASFHDIMYHSAIASRLASDVAASDL